MAATRNKDKEEKEPPAWLKFLEEEMNGVIPDELAVLNQQNDDERKRKEEEEKEAELTRPMGGFALYALQTKEYLDSGFTLGNI